jgi:SAM-dependent methyltransferase
MENKSESKKVVPYYLDFIAAKSRAVDREDLWRAYLKDVYQNLKNRWCNEASIGRALKTDLFDEAISRHGLLSLFENKCDHIVGVDIAFETAQAARHRQREAQGEHCLIAVSDARRQSFQSCTFDEIFSNSTLDHFPNRADLMASLEELHRILRRGGLLIITLDNPQNPVVWIRNRLPYRWLKRLGIIPYYMGVTLSRSELVRTLESIGFAVSNSTVLVHSPRALAIWAGLIIGKLKHEKIRASFRKLLSSFECLEHLPTKNITGYFVAVKAVKR